MRQVIQNVRSGELSVESVPDPMAVPGQLLIANQFSVISAGTERSLRQLARKSLLGKARERPDQVKRVLEKVRNEGLWNTVQQVQGKLGEPMPMGYSSAGIVLACGKGVEEFRPGDRVASNGSHAEVVSVPKHLCALVPEQVPLDNAAFTVLGAIAMQGVRLSRLALGETALVIGLGLIGQLTVGLLKAAGIRVLATDLSAEKCDLAIRMGAAVAATSLSAADVVSQTSGRGADAVLITASTKSDVPIRMAADAVRSKGRVVAVGAVSLDLPRRPFYFKEAEFVVSCSYGPGRYDPSYEDGGHDYPVAHVRWTEQRNMQAILDLMGQGRLDVSPLISSRYSVADAERAYERIECGEAVTYGIVLEYPQADKRIVQDEVRLQPRPVKMTERVGIGCLGAGNFARTTLLPRLCALPMVAPVVICSAGGLNARVSGEKLGFSIATSDDRRVFDNPDVDAIFVLTRHHQHASQVVQSLRVGKRVFVEKPLCLTLEELTEIEAELDDSGGTERLMVGFNRRFSPAARAVRGFFAGESAPLTISIRFNAGQIPEDHWLQDEEIGGGRIVGEACHAIDLATFLAGSPVVRVFAESVGGQFAPQKTHDQCFITLRHANGSVSNIAYLAGGDKAFPKERIEVFGAGKVATIDDFRLAESWSGGRRRRLWKGAQDKGHAAELIAFVEAVRHGDEMPIAWKELRATTLASILAMRSLREGAPLDVALFSPRENWAA